MKKPKFRLRGFIRPSEAIINSLGKLEYETLQEVWRQKEVNVHQVSTAFDGCIAYTTIMTTLDRLYKKGLLNRRKEGRAFYYTARFTSEELERGLAEDVMDNLLNISMSQIEPVLSCIVDAVSDRDRDLLDELARLVKAKQLELKEKE